MITTNSYEISNEELLDRFMKACAKAGISNSGLCISVFAGYELEEAHYLKGVVLARLDKQNPPFKSGDIVKAKSDQSVHSDNRSAHYYRFNLPADKTQKIGRVHYAGSGKWQLSFNGIKDSEGWNPRFSADSFCLAPAEVLVSSS